VHFFVKYVHETDSQKPGNGQGDMLLSAVKKGDLNTKRQMMSVRMVRFSQLSFVLETHNLVRRISPLALGLWLAVAGEPSQRAWERGCTKQSSLTNH